MDWTTRLTQALEYLEDNLEGPVSIEKAAELANCSFFHFCRMFEVVFNVSPAEYVRRRRLSKAALDIAAGGEKVIDAALRYGWDSPESFAKAFKRCFGITPSEAKEGKKQLELWPPIRLAVMLKGDKTMKYKIEEKKAFDCIGITIRTTNTDNQNMHTIPQFWEKNGKAGVVDAIAKYSGKMGLLGVCYDYNCADETFAYSIAVEKGKEPLSSFPEGSHVFSIPSATYAAFECRGPNPEAVQKLWKDIYADWFPSSDYEHAGTADFEVYPMQDPIDLPDMSSDYRTEVWIPIKKKSK